LLSLSPLVYYYVRINIANLGRLLVGRADVRRLRPGRPSMWKYSDHDDNGCPTSSQPAVVSPSSAATAAVAAGVMLVLTATCRDGQLPSELKQLAREVTSGLPVATAVVGLLQSSSGRTASMHHPSRTLQSPTRRRRRLSSESC